MPAVFTIFCFFLFAPSSGQRCDLHVVSDGMKQSGVVHSPLYPNSYPSLDTRCTYEFTSKAYERVQIIFEEFNLFLPKGDTPDICKTENDQMSAYINLSGRMSELGSFCGSEIPPQLMSSGNYLSLDFVAQSFQPMPSNIEGYRFKFTYKFVDDFGMTIGQRDRNYVCGFIFSSSQSTNGTFHSPNYPGYYPRNTDCHYEFRGKPGQKIMIYFTYFDIEGYKQCQNFTQSDYVAFSNFRFQDRSHQRYCGSETPMKNQPIQSDANYFQMIFHSNNIFDATGFFATYQFTQIEPKGRPKISGKASASESPSSAQHCDPFFTALIMPVIYLFASE